MYDGAREDSDFNQEISGDKSQDSNLAVIVAKDERELQGQVILGVKCEARVLCLRSTVRKTLS